MKLGAGILIFNDKEKARPLDLLQFPLMVNVSLFPKVMASFSPASEARTVGLNCNSLM